MINVIYFQNEKDLDPEDIEFDEHYTTETHSKCIKNLVTHFL